MNDTKKIKGKIIKIHPDGYGFIISDEMKFIKFFFHWTSLNHSTKKFPELKSGMKVEFVPVLNDDVNEEDEKKKGPHAIKIEIL
jgi:cold shock CspA family protein